MADDTLSIYREARSFNRSLAALHPLKLDRWHRGLVGLPDAIYMQYGCEDLAGHVWKALEGVKAMVDMLGEENLPVDPQEIARRRIGSFSWHTTSSLSDAGTIKCSLTWDHQNTAWVLSCDAAPIGTKKTISSFEAGFEKGSEWVADLEKAASSKE